MTLIKKPFCLSFIIHLAVFLLITKFSNYKDLTVIKDRGYNTIQVGLINRTRPANNIRKHDGRKLSGKPSECQKMSKNKTNPKNPPIKRKRQMFGSISDKINSIIKNQKTNILGKKTNKTGNPNISKSEFDKLRKHITSFWHIPTGITNLQGLNIPILITTNSNGEVIAAQLLNSGTHDHPHYKVVSEAALRAVLEPNAQPLPIPERYKQENQSIVITFSPLEML